MDTGSNKRRIVPTFLLFLGRGLDMNHIVIWMDGIIFKQRFIIIYLEIDSF